jgi:hypothetical protein
LAINAFSFALKNLCNLCNLWGIKLARVCGLFHKSLDIR